MRLPLRLPFLSLAAAIPVSLSQRDDNIPTGSILICKHANYIDCTTVNAYHFCHSLNAESEQYASLADWNKKISSIKTGKKTACYLYKGFGCEKGDSEFMTVTNVHLANFVKETSGYNDQVSSIRCWEYPKTSVPPP